MHMRNVPVCYEGKLEFRDAKDQVLNGDLDDKSTFPKLQKTEKVLIKEIQNPIVQDLLLDYKFPDEAE